jgi:pantothenate kinase-related protein Tda10
MVISYVFLFGWFVGLQSLNPMFQAAVVAAEEEAPDDDAKAKVVAKYRLLGNVIIVGSLVFLVGGAVLFYAWRVYG